MPSSRRYLNYAVPTSWLLRSLAGYTTWFVLDLLGRLQDSLGELGDERDRIHRLLILQADRSENGHRAEALRSNQGGRSDQHHTMHFRNRLFQSNHHTNVLLPRIDICIEQLDQPPLRLECAQQLAQAVAVDLTREQIANPFHIDRRPIAVAVERALPAKLPDRVNELVIFVTLLLDSALKFAANLFHRPAAKVFIQEVARRGELGDREVVV